MCYQRRVAMKNRIPNLLGFLLLIMILGACTVAPTSVPAISSPVVKATSTAVVLPSLTITLGKTDQPQGIMEVQGGDADTKAVAAGDSAQEARVSGNGKALPASDANNTPDSYFQFNVDDSQLSNGKPTTHVRVEVDYFDQGTDSFSLQYDALPNDGSDGLFAGGGSVVKTNTRAFKIATFNLCDANFANRDNGTDFRISDNGDGAEIISAVRVIGLPAGAARLNVDDFGANPFDDQPDSDAIQT